MATQCYQITLYAVLICVSFIVNTWANLEEKTAAFINAEQAKIMSNQAYLDIEIYKLRLASLIEESAKQGNTAVFTVLPKHLPLEDIRHLSAELTQLGYQVRLEVEEFYYRLNVYWI